MERIVLFDGVCNFCNATVNWIIRQDREKKFKFAPLQSEFGQQQRAKFGLSDDIDSIVLIDDGQAYTHSTAALRIAKALGGIWSLGYTGILVPRVLRDWFYKLFAANRYRIFGKKDVCTMPTADVRERFVS